MTTWPPITREDLKDAAGRPGFDTMLPLLVRRLIAETADGLTELGMPGGSGVAAGGFDGVVTATGQTVEVPAGKSVWELSVTGGAGSKADKDYDKRTSGPNGDSPRDVVYVQVILSVWTKARQWSAQRTAENRWKEVRAYNLDTIDTWLDRAPATTAWLAGQVMKAMPGVRAADEWFNSTWLPSTKIPFDAALVLAGRDEAVGALLKQLNGRRRTTTVGGALTVDEFKAVVAAALSRADLASRELLYARTLFVDDPVSLAQLVAQGQPLVLVLADARLAANLPDDHSHQFVIRAQQDRDIDVTFGPVDADAVRAYLEAMGEPWERAGRLGALARRSVSALRRLLANKPAILMPSWVDDINAMRRRALLLGGWEGDETADRALVERVTGRSYTEVEDAALALANLSDIPALGRLATRWHLLAPDDTWLLLRDRLTRDDIAAILDAAVSVLSEPDPVFGLDQATRLKLQWQGTRRIYSSALRRGIATTLAMLGTTDLPVPSMSSSTGADLVRLPIRKIFVAASADRSYALWSALRDVISLLAEAAPDEFLDAMRDGLRDPNPLHICMFTDSADDSALGSIPTHSEFLWALETLAWSSDYFDEVVEILAHLAELDPGGRYSNRPSQSLLDIFSCWHPMTTADEEQRTAALRRLIRKHPDVGRRLLVALIPDGHEWRISRPGPRFRQILSPSIPGREEVNHNIAAVINIALDDLQDHPERFLALIEKIDHLSPEHRRRFADAMTRLGSTLDDDTARATLRDAVLKTTRRHRKYADTRWALPAPELDLLDAAAAQLVPRSIRLELAWLFAEVWVDFGDVSHRDDFEAHDWAVLDRRADAVGQVLAKEGLDGVVALAGATEFPHLVGIALGKHTGSYDTSMLNWLTEDPVRHEVAYAYLSRRLRDEGEVLLDTLLDAADSAEVKGSLMRATHEPEWSWARLPALGNEVEQAYWRKFQPYGLGRDFEGVVRAAEGLMSVQRYAAALDLLAIYSEQIRTPDAAQAMAAACEGLLTATEPDAEIGRLSSYSFSQIAALLHDHQDLLGIKRIIAIEWQLFPGLGFQPKAPSMHAMLASDPTFFVELVELAYRGDDEVEQQPQSDENRKQNARRAFEVLRSWRQCPGANSDGRVDESVLRAWVDAARALLSERNRSTPGDVQIGQILAHAAPDVDGTFPPAAIRSLLEGIESDHIEDGLQIEIFNMRGVTTRGSFDGGDQERKLALRYRAAADAARTWPRTRKILRTLADTYERDARRHDEEAEHRRRGLDG